MNEETRVLTRKINQLEVGMVRVQAALSGFAQVLQQTAGGAVNCAVCENDITSMKTCAVDDCPCGFPAAIEGEDDVSSDD